MPVTKQGSGVKRGASVSPNKEEAGKKAKVEGASVNNNMGDEAINNTLQQVLKNIKDMRTEFNGRIDQLEEKITEKIKGVVKEEVGKVRDDLQKQIDSLQKNMENVQTQLQNGDGRDQKQNCNVVMFGIPETANENIINKVNAVIREGVKQNVEVETAVRKASKKQGKPGVVIAKFKSAEDKRLVMEHKKVLSKSINHKNIGIDHERSADELLHQANMRVLTEAIGKNKVTLKGKRLVPAHKNGAQR